MVAKGFCEYINELAIKALLYEVSVTPKPGLVDRNNSGAHDDMDFFTFMDSVASLGSIFSQCAQKGVVFSGSVKNELLKELRPIGIIGEERMFAATGGINTHKGLIFSLGIISAAAGLLYQKKKSNIFTGDEVCEEVKLITAGLTQSDFTNLHKKTKLTHGERNFTRYGVKGIRGEVESGFETVRSAGLPVLKTLLSTRKESINDILVQVLLYLMQETEDSNIIARHDIETLRYVKASAREALSLGGIFTTEGRTKILDMDKDFIHKHISPGGSADLLAVTLMLYFLENPKKFF